MSHQLSWIGIKSNDYSSVEIINALNLEHTGNTDSFNDFEMATLVMNNGWLILGINDFLSPLIQDLNLVGYSKVGEVIGFQAHEGIMVSKMSRFYRGDLTCVVFHDAQKGLNHLVEHGELPIHYAEMKSQAIKEQKEHAGLDCLFEVPVLVAEHFVGYKYGTVSNENKYQEVIFKNKSKVKNICPPEQQSNKLWTKSSFWN